MSPLLRQIGAILCAVVAWGCSDPDEPADAGLAAVGASPAEARDAYASLAALGNGFVVWESNRTGSWRIWTRGLDGSGLRQLSPDEPERDHFGAHVSPDGTRIAYLSYPRGRNSYHPVPPDVPIELRILHLADGREQTVARDARSYGQSRSVVWIDGHRLFYVTRGLETRELDLRTGDASLVAKPPPGKRAFLLNPQKSHGTSNDPLFSPFDAEARTLAPSARRAGCQSYLTRDGRFGFWTTRSGGPILRIDLASERTGTIVDKDDPRLDPSFRYVYFPMVSPDQRLLTFGASNGDHDHFRTDYEIFVAPIDPMTLELVGDPIRYTFDVGVDRFPDVFVGGLELGHLGGEAPFAVEIDPEHVSPDHVEGGPWRWDFGDGQRVESAVGRHAYEAAGTYALVARRGDEELHARVDVKPPRPPAVLRTVVRGREVDVVFDEPIDVAGVEATLVSGVPLASVALRPDRHTLRVAAAADLPTRDVLRLEGVRDRVGHDAPPQELEVERSTWPRDPARLVYLFGTALDENRVRLPGSDREVVFPIQSRGRARLNHDHALALAGGAFEAQGAGQAFARSCRDAEAVTLELMLTPHGVERGDRGQIALLETEGGRFLLQLVQRGDELRARVRTHEADPEETIATLGSSEPTHLVVSYHERGRLVAYRDGGKVFDSDRVQGDLEKLDEASLLLFGSDSKGEHDWRGALEGIALYCRFMEEGEAAANAHAALARVEAREVTPRLRLRARLVAASDPPTLEEIAPYREALAVSEWEVLRVEEGELGEDRIRVAHWAVLGGATQPLPSLRPGKARWLDLEPFEDNPQVAEHVLADTLDLAPDLSLFLDVGP